MCTFLQRRQLHLNCILYPIIFPRLSFALSASKIKEKARVVALDLRGHGKSSTDNDLNLSIEVCACETASEGGKSEMMNPVVLLF